MALKLKNMYRLPPTIFDIFTWDWASPQPLPPPLALADIDELSDSMETDTVAELSIEDVLLFVPFIAAQF